MSVDRAQGVSSPPVRIHATMPSVQNWSLWQEKPRVIAYCALAEILAVFLTVTLLLQSPVAGSDLLIFLALLGLGVLQAELGRQVERLRRRVSGVAHINMTSVWIFAGVLVLPPAMTAILTATLYLHLGVRSWYRLQKTPVWRTTNNAAVLVLTSFASYGVLAMFGVHGMGGAIELGWAGAGVVGVTMLAHFVANALLVIPARNTIARTVKGLFGGPMDNMLELATLCLGALNALTLAIMPGLTVLVLPPLLILHRGVLVKQLEAAATTDAKTGVLNTAGWHNRAEVALARAQQQSRTFGTLMIDLDHFKRINDTYGHLAGDEVLRAVATAIASEVRERDLVGRFGGEEFVVLLPDIGEADVTAVAERIRIGISRLEVDVPETLRPTTIDDLSASIGVAMYPDAGGELQRLLDAADTALYTAKNNGRNRVVRVRDLGVAEQRLAS
ncbi:MAG: diguanylate cyclase [Actinophytocola sp.]|nr:diguanylate cyclase [Actinophytocola sp.]